MAAAESDPESIPSPPHNAHRLLSPGLLLFYNQENCVVNGKNVNDQQKEGQELVEKSLKVVFDDFCGRHRHRHHIDHSSVDACLFTQHHVRNKILHVSVSIVIVNRVLIDQR